MTLPHRLAEYDTPEGAREYLEEYRKAHRQLSDRRERRLLGSFFRQMEDVTTVLDLPSGWGRYLEDFRRRGLQVVEADYSGEMLRLGRRLFPEAAVRGRCRASGGDLPFADRSVDLVFSMRLSHHLADPELRRRHLHEVFRVARRYAVLSYFDAATLKNRLRELRVRLGAGKRRKNALDRGEVRAAAAAHGFRVLRDPLLFWLGSGHRLVFAERTAGS